jgi:hypothetical protein
MDASDGRLRTDDQITEEMIAGLGFQSTASTDLQSYSDRYFILENVSEDAGGQSPGHPVRPHTRAPEYGS